MPNKNTSDVLLGDPSKKNWSHEDWSTVWIGLGAVMLAYILYLSGSSQDMAWISIAPAKWATFLELQTQLESNVWKYAVQFIVFSTVLTTGAALIGQKPKHFFPAFALLYVLAFIIIAAGSWNQAQRYNLEPPLLALIVGLVASNVFRLPSWLDAGFRVEFFIKVGIVLLGATLPVMLIIWAGPVAILQASLVSIITFLVIFFTGRLLGLSNQLSAVLGAGGAVCGVSASIAVAGAVRAKKTDPPIAISLVVFWAIIMIFALPFVSKAMHLPAGVAGAWIGTSEYADSAGLAAATAYGDFVGPNSGIDGTKDQSIAAYTLIKVIGRDAWIGVWCVILAYIAVTRWDNSSIQSGVPLIQIWNRFPKFVLGFIIASVLTSIIVNSYSLQDYTKLVKPALIAPLTSLRVWAFTFSFLSIGFTTRLREFASVGSRPFIAFSVGVAVNLLLGYLLCTWALYDFWAKLATPH